ncbi:MAG: hypothetical protein WC145_13235 [Aliarcobacter sp.]|nr:hypothetical protein [Candidatus Omnitrophota bacterium]MDD5049898.1 hypothetical protein [Methanoregulaceae archaeon]
MEPNGIKTFRVAIRGTKPLLLHSTRVMTDAPKLARGAKLPPEDEAELGLYKNKSGQIILPEDVILGAIKAAAVDFKVPGKGKKTYKNYVDSGLELESDALLEPQTYEIDSRPVVVQRSRVIRSRPRFDEWSTEFRIIVLDTDTWIDPFDKVYGGGANLRDVIAAAGKYKGLCDYRPRFGRFDVVGFAPCNVGD